MFSSLKLLADVNCSTVVVLDYKGLWTKSKKGALLKRLSFFST